MQIASGVDILKSVALHHFSGSIRRRLWPTYHEDGFVAVQRYERLHDGMCLNHLVLCYWNFELSRKILCTCRFVLSSAIGDEDIGDLLVARVVTLENLKRSLRLWKYLRSCF